MEKQTQVVPKTQTKVVPSLLDKYEQLKIAYNQLLEEYKRLEKQTKIEQLENACLYGNFNEVKQLVQEGVDVNLNQGSPLYIASERA